MQIVTSKTWSQIQRIKKMKTHKIHIEGLPEGWKPVSITTLGNIDSCNTIGALIHLEKIKPRRIVLEETDTDNFITGGIFHIQYVAGVELWNEPKIWREVK